jgi:hypothetical protein
MLCAIKTYLKEANSSRNDNNKFDKSINFVEGEVGCLEGSEEEEKKTNFVTLFCIKMYLFTTITVAMACLGSCDSPKVLVRYLISWSHSDCDGKSDIFQLRFLSLILVDHINNAH